MRKPIRTLLVALCAVAVALGMTPAASASPLSEFLDQFDFGSSGPPPVGSTPQPVAVRFGPNSAQPSANFTPRSSACMDLPPNPRFVMAFNFVLPLPLSRNADESCRDRDAFVRYTIFTSDGRAGGFAVTLTPGGQRSTYCYEVPNPTGNPPLTCTATPDLVTFTY